jgi:ubiquinone/menaquinone biosynthesis C-methylase UbiE
LYENIRMKISNDIQKLYDEQYDASIQAWRELAAYYKAKNIVNLAQSISFKNILEVGCGEGSILKWLDEWDFCENMFAVEISASGFEYTQKRNLKSLKDIQLFDGYHLPFEDGQFDLVYCSHVIEHVEFPRQIIREIQRVSKYQIYEVPIDFSFYVDKKIKHFLDYGHINIYTPALFRFLLLTEAHLVLKDKCFLYPHKILKHLYQKKTFKLYMVKAKNFIIQTLPYLRGIKPNSYAILTTKNQDFKIQENKNS